MFHTSARMASFEGTNINRLTQAGIEPQ